MTALQVLQVLQYSSSVIESLTFKAAENLQCIQIIWSDLDVQRNDCLQEFVADSLLHVVVKASPRSFFEESWW